MCTVSTAENILYSCLKDGFSTVEKRKRMIEMNSVRKCETGLHWSDQDLCAEVNEIWPRNQFGRKRTQWRHTEGFPECCFPSVNRKGG